MHSATELMLARMESNPEEFDNSMNGRWGNILTKLCDCLPEEEWNIIRDRLKAVRLENIHKQIMQELCAPQQGNFEFKLPDYWMTLSPEDQAISTLQRYIASNKKYTK